MTVAEQGPAAPAGSAVLPVAFCPAPPLMLPVLAGAAAEETAVLRTACAEAVEEVLAFRPEVVVVVGPGGRPGVRYGAGDAADLRDFGLPLSVPFAGRARPGGRRVPVAHTVGAWLLDQAGCGGVRLGVDPADLGETLAGLPGPVAVLALGDGSARRTVKAPGYLDPAAEPFDGAIAAALAAGDAAALAALDQQEGERLMAAGVATWRAVGRALAGRPVSGRLLAHQAPYGVGYLVAAWLAR